MTRPTTLALTALALLLGATVRTEGPAAKTPPATAELRQLQGTSGHSLHFQGPRADLRYDATFKVENGVLSLAGLEDDAPSTLDDAEAFERNTAFHYRLRKVSPGAKTACALKPEPTPSSAPWNPLKWPE
jgi:hypothetical protein